MNYAEIKYCDVANGPGVRTSLFVSGCSHHCPGCFNEIAWDFNYGKPFTQDTIDSIIESLKPDYIQGLTLLGGEPFEYSNQKGLLPLVRQVREVLPQKDIWCFTGFLFDKDIIENMCKRWKETNELQVILMFLLTDALLKSLKITISNSKALKTSVQSL